MMKFFVDTAEIDEIRDLNALGLVDGVTTNPSLVKKSGRDFIETIREICDEVEGPVSAETVALDYDGMMAEGRKLAQLAPNIAVKVPLTWDGLKACRALSDEGRMVNVTLCFSANQALLAAKAGATFISPFVGRLDDINLDGMDLIRDIRHHLRQLRLRDRDPRGLDPQRQPRQGGGADRRRRDHRAGRGAAQARRASADRQGADGVPEGLVGDRPEDRVRQSGGDDSMTETATRRRAIREQILSDPGLILEDHELMRALLQADRSAQGRNVVDLRGVLVDRLEERLDRLEDTHREVLAAAYENVAGMNQVHRACLALLEPGDFAGFLQVADPRRGADPRGRGDPARARGAGGASPGAGLGPAGAVPGRGGGAARRRGRRLCHPGARARGAAGDAAPAREASPDLYGAEAPEIRSEALLRLDLGDGQPPRAARLRRQRPRPRFHPDQGTDLLAFFGGVFERSLRRWLA